MFGEAAERLGVKLVFATDRCDQLEDPWWDGAIPIRFHQEASAVRDIVAVAATSPFEGVLAVGDRPTVIAAYAAHLLDLPGHPPEGASAARDKRLTRECLKAAGMPVPWFTVVPATLDPRPMAATLEYPVVVKPAALSGSRGVMRADNPAGFVLAFERLRRLLNEDDVRAMQDPAAEDIIVESFIEGREFALEGVLERGALRTLAIFDKPDPLEGPYFEETIYVTPSTADPAVQDRLCRSVAEATPGARAAPRSGARGVPRQRPWRLRARSRGPAHRRAVRPGAAVRRPGRSARRPRRTVVATRPRREHCRLAARSARPRAS